MTENKRDVEEVQTKRRRESPFRFAEGCLYNYQENLARLERLRADLAKLSSRTVTNYEAEGHAAGTHSDPVLKCVQQREALEGEIAGLERRTDPVTRLLADLESPNVLKGSPYAQIAKILRLYYFGKNSREQISNELKIGMRTIYEKRAELVKMAIRYLGL